MNHDELAFFNRQLAAMLRDGIPLEGALKQLCAGMKEGPFRAEITFLEKDLAQGVPLDQALTRRTLPEFYKRMIVSGAKGNDLPGMLTLLADYYERLNSAWNRLKGLMVYPFLVLAVSLVVTCGFSMLARKFTELVEGEWNHSPPIFLVAVWIPPLLIAVLLAAGAAAVSVRSWRARLRWSLPAFRETSLAQLASAMSIMLRSGTPFPDALALAAVVESNSPAGPALLAWRGMVESGQGKPGQWPRQIRPLPPLFMWLVQKGGEDLAAGFQKAAEVYDSRASYKMEMALYGVLPVSILVLAQMVIWQVVPVFRMLIQMMNMLGGN